MVPYMTWEGGSQVTLALANGFVRKGHSVELVVLNQVSAVQANPSTIFPTAKYLEASNLYQAIRRLRSFLKGEPYDVLLGMGDSASMVMAIACASIPRPYRRKRYVVVGSEHFHTSAKFGDFPNTKGRILGWLMRLGYRNLDAIVCVNRDLQRRVQEELEWSRGPVVTIHNPLRLDFANAKSVEVARFQRRQRGEDFLVVGAGALYERKDWSTVIRAFALSSCELPLQMRIAGDGIELPRLKALCADLGVESRVKFVGVVDDMQSLLQQADIFVLGSTGEAFGLVLIEALSQGVPIVCANSAGPSEIVTTTGQGLVVGVGDSLQMSNAITATLLAPPPAVSLIESTRRFAVDKVSSEYLNLFESELASMNLSG